MVLFTPNLLVEGIVSHEHFPRLFELNAGLPANLQLLTHRDILQ